MRIAPILISLLFVLSYNGLSQTCTTLGQTPATAFPVCGTTTFSQSNVPSCGGRPIPGPCGPGLNDVNPFYYKFTCYTAGTLGFLITPISMADDYDWQLFDITGRNPDDIYADASLFVACNWSGSTGITGAVPAGIGLTHCAGGVPIFSAMPTLVVGHEYLLMVSNWSNSQQGYSLNFTGGTAGITDPLAPGVLSASTNCDGTQITIRFNKKMRCNSLAANGSDFIINPGGTVISASSVDCSSGFDLDSAMVTLSTPLAGGNYTISMANGSDANTVLDICGTPVPVGSGAPFTVTAQAPIPLGTVVQPGCMPTSLTLNFTDPIKCNSIAANGSDFTVTGTSSVTVTGATPVACNANGETTSITLQLSGAIISTGNYTVNANVGADGNTLIGACNRQVTAGTTTPFNLPAQPPLAMGGVPQPPCTPTFIDFDLPDAVFCNSIAADGSDFTITGPSGVIITGAAPVSCNAASQATTIRIHLAAPIAVSGNFTLTVTTGSDGNSLVGTCGRIIPAATTTAFNIAPQAPIAMGTIPVQPCAPVSFTITFADSILCSSIAPNGSDFSITGPSAVTISSATGACSPNGRTREITLNFASPINVDGQYQVDVIAGSDGNTLIGNCARIVNAGSTTTFDVPVAPAAAMDAIEPFACAPSTLRLNLNAAVRCNSIAGNGSDFILTGPATINIISATGVCDANGFATSIDITLASPIVVGGNYSLQLVAGSDGNTLLNDCYRATAPASINFAAVDTVSAEFTHTIQYDCEFDQIDFNHPGGNGVNSWTWTVNGTAAGNTQSISQSFSASSNNLVELTVSNGTCSDTWSTAIVLDNKVVVDFEIPESVCPGDTAVIKNLSTGLIDTWEWDFGNGNTATIQHPLSPTYPTTGVETLYTISLTASNAGGCELTTSKTLVVLGSCLIAVPTAFTPNNDGLNDFLFPLNALKADNLDFKVFNRWGQLVFHSRNWMQKWDGRINGADQATGVFVWSLNYVDRDTREAVSMKGTTLLIR